MTDRRAALVTGGSRGIGRAICLELARAGYHVVVNFQSREDAALATLEAIRLAGGEGEICQFDVADRATVAVRIADLVERLPMLDTLVNNAGVTADGLLATMPDSDWDRVIRTSLDGFFHVTKPIVKRLIRLKRGSIVTISSVAALRPNRGQANYAAAKAGLIGASRSLASEMARLNVRVNVVAPGLIATEMTDGLPLEKMLPLIPMQRVGTPEEVAKVVRFLCSDDASYVTGQVISVNGGMI